MKSKVDRFEELIVWKESRELNRLAFEALKNCNSFFFRDQALRSALSISSNIAEGFERNGNKEFIRFLYIAKASCGELRSQIYLGLDTEVFTPDIADPLIIQCKRVSFLIFQLIKSLSSFT